jgi:hypothetical protein
VSLWSFLQSLTTTMLLDDPSSCNSKCPSGLTNRSSRENHFVPSVSIYSVSIIIRLFHCCSALCKHTTMTNDSSDHQQSGHFPFGLFMVITMAAMLMFNTLSTLFGTGRKSRVAETAEFVAEKSKDGQPKKDESIARKEELITRQISDEVARDEEARDKPVVASNSKYYPSSMSGELSVKNNWRCACEGGFLPPGLLKTFGGVESVYKMGIGDCYHKKM